MIPSNATLTTHKSLLHRHCGCVIYDGRTYREDNVWGDLDQQPVLWILFWTGFDSMCTLGNIPPQMRLTLNQKCTALWLPVLEPPRKATSLARLLNNWAGPWEQEGNVIFSRMTSAIFRALTMRSTAQKTEWKHSNTPLCYSCSTVPQTAQSGAMARLQIAISQIRLHDFTPFSCGPAQFILVVPPVHHAGFSPGHWLHRCLFLRLFI